MSSEKKADEGAAGKKKSKLPLIIIGAVMLLGGGGAGAWYFMGAKKKDTAQEAPKPKPPVFATLENFTVNLMPEGGSQNYLQTAMTLKVADAAVAEDVKQNMAEVRNRILFLLSSKKASELLTISGKRKLSDEILRETLAVIAPHDIENEAREKRLEKERAKKRAARKKSEEAEGEATEAGEKDDKGAKAQKSEKSKDGAEEEEEEAPPPPPRKPPPAPKLLGVLFTSFIIQ